jgi:hypothetical protein
MPCCRAIQLAGFIFAVGFNSVSSKVRSIRNWQGQYFQRYLYYVDSNDFIPNVTGQNAYWFKG